MVHDKDFSKKKAPPFMPALKGVRLATSEADIKYKNRRDLLMIVFDEGANVAGVFTRSRCPSAPVDHCRAALRHGRARAVIVNSGNANAFTGRRGLEAVATISAAAAKLLDTGQNEVYLASTGVIGEPLDSGKITRHLAQMVNEAKEDQWLQGAQAIMTTDTYAKMATASLELDGVKVSINGIAKGAGMIAPDMATMLSFVVTDAAISSAVLQNLLTEGVEKSFNSISVDSDTSTSDTLLLFATGSAQAGGMTEIATMADPRLPSFKAALDNLLLDLALQVINDGEGARHLIQVEVIGATTNQSAKKIAFAIVNSPLVKTAVAGEDANWGRVVMAVGKSGEEADRDKLSIWFGDQRVAFNGERDPHYDEASVAVLMKARTITVRVDIGLGAGHATVWGCDLTKEYVAINGDYRS